VGELGRVTDPEALARDDGPRARHAITIPAAWARSGAELAVTVPRRLVCARCEGGGCDACARGGALRAPDDDRERTIRVHVPAGSGAGAVLRIVRPFGEASPIAQLLLAIEPGAAPSAGVARVPTALARRAPWPGLLVVSAAIVPIAAAVALSR
jgi:hypothetical protein